MIPLRVVNTMNLGRAMAAKIDTGEPGWTGWLFVRGIAERARTWDAIRKAWTLDRTATQAFEPPRAFVVRYTRLSDAHLALRLPANVDYPEPPPGFARERTLEEVLGP